MKFWDVRTWREVFTLNHSYPVTALAFSQDGKSLITATSGGTAILWDLATRKELRLLKGHVGEIQLVVFSPDGKRIITGGSDGYIKFWDVATGQEVFSVKYQYLITALALSPDGKTLASADETSLRLWFADESRNSTQTKVEKLLKLAGAGPHSATAERVPD